MRPSWPQERQIGPKLVTKAAKLAPSASKLAPKRPPRGVQERLECKTARTSKFDDSTAFFTDFSRFGKPGDRLCSRLEPLGRAGGRQFDNSEAKLDGQVRPRAAQRAQEGTPDRARVAQDYRIARQARPKSRPAGQAERASGRKSFLPSLRLPEMRSDLAEL